MDFEKDILPEIAIRLEKHYNLDREEAIRYINESPLIHEYEEDPELILATSISKLTRNIYYYNKIKKRTKYLFSSFFCHWIYIFICLLCRFFKYF